MTAKKLDASIPANNSKIIELYNKMKKGELNPKPSFQRKLVWKKQHKYKFIETILQNFPFPEIYIAPGQMDTDKLILVDLIVDGQQRCTTIVNYIEASDVFALPNAPITSFNQLPKEAKEDFLNYEVSIRYLKNATEVQIKEIFQRINSTEYALNKTERTNAQWGESEFICFAKQIIEKDLDIDPKLINYRISQQSRTIFLDFFHNKYSIFTENDVNRMLALQYLLTLITTLVEDDYFRRNDKVQMYIERYNEEFTEAADVEHKFLHAIRLINDLKLDKSSYWFNKANIFTLIIEISKFDPELFDKEKLRHELVAFDADYRIWMSQEFEFSNGLGDKSMISGSKVISSDLIKYYDYAREAVNESYAREYRGKIVNIILRKCLDKSN